MCRFSTSLEVTNLMSVRAKLRTNKKHRHEPKHRTLKRLPSYVDISHV